MKPKLLLASLDLAVTLGACALLQSDDLQLTLNLENDVITAPALRTDLITEPSNLW